MFSLLAVAFAALVGLAILGLLFGAVALVIWVVTLPFRLLGFAFKALGALLFLPFFALLGLALATLVGIPLLLAALIPAIPIVLLVAGVWWLATHAFRPANPSA